MNLNKDLSEIYTAVEKELQCYALDTTGMPLVGVKVIKIINRPFSNCLILRADFNYGSKMLVTKTPIHHPVNKAVMDKENQAEVEFNILSFLYPRFQNIQGCCVPEPILVLPEIETFVMGYVKGDMLVDKLRAANCFASRSNYSKLKNDFFYCGRWLRHFQESTGIHSAGPEALDAVIENCDYRLSLIEEADHKKCPKTLRADVMDFVRQQQRLLGESDVVVSGRHSDFGPWNILTGKNEIIVIDYLGYDIGPIEVDLLKMLMSFDNDEKAIRSCKKRIELLKKFFLDGYGELYNIRYPVQKICEAHHRIASLESAINDNVAFRHHRKLEGSRRFKANLNWLLYDRGEKTLLIHTYL